MSDPQRVFDAEVYAVVSSHADEGEIRRHNERLRPWYLTFLAPWLPSDKRSRILDVPCGAGNLLHALVTAGYENVTGADSDQKRVTLAHEMGLPARHADAFETVESAAPGSVDRIFSLDFLEHISRQDAARFCRAAHAALAPGGILLARTPSADGPFGSHDRFNDITHQWAMTVGSAHVLMLLGGFAPTDISVHQEAPVPYKWQNWFRRRLFDVTTRAVGAYLNLCGIDAPRVWTRSMWIVARKAAA